MAEYIEREALIYDLEHCGVEKKIADAIVYRIGLHEAADVSPVVHSKWTVVEDEYGSYAKCQNCGEEFTFYDADCALTNFCPNCGAKMDGGEQPCMN